MKECAGWNPKDFDIYIPKHLAPFSNFTKHKGKLDGYQDMCKDCKKIYNTARNPQVNSDPKYDAIRAKCHGEAIQARSEAQPAYVSEIEWVREQHQEIRRKREDLNRIHGLKTWAVDHIIPIGNRVRDRDGICGLDVPWNMEIIPHCTNSRKSDAVPWHRIIKKG